MVQGNLICRVFSLARPGHQASDCQDASAHYRLGARYQGTNGLLSRGSVKVGPENAASAPGNCLGAHELGRFAIADGASESAQSALWAQLLVHSFVTNGQEIGASPGFPSKGRQGGQKGPDWQAWLPPLQQVWTEEVNPQEANTQQDPSAATPARGPGARNERRDPSSAERSESYWYVAERTRRGAFATFLGLVVEEDGQWHATAVGDSCLFHTRASELKASFPLKHSGEFGNSPWLVGSLASLEVPIKQCQQASGHWATGDRLWLMTDALAQWFLKEYERRQQPWWTLCELLFKPDHHFAHWVEVLRRQHMLRDDVTLLAICC